MTVRPSPRLVVSLKTFSRRAGVVVALIGVAVLLGWMFEIQRPKSILPQLASMRPNTSFCFLLAGIALWLLQQEPVVESKRRLAQGLALIVALVGLLTLAEYGLGWDMGIDQLLFREEAGAVGTSHPGRMSTLSALNFVLCGLALPLLSFERPATSLHAQCLALVAGVLSMVGLIGYLYSVASFYTLIGGTPIPLQTALTFGVLFIGVLSARPDQGLAALVASEGVGGLLLRRFLPLAIGIPVVLGWLRLEGQRAGFYDTEFGLGIVTTLMVIIFSCLIWFYARSLEASDRQQKKAEEEINRLFDLSLDLQCIAGFDGYFKRLNRAWEKTLGFPTAELTARPYIEFIHPEDREATRAEARKQSRGEVVTSFENRYRCKDGSYKWLAWTAYPIAEAQLIYGAARDITASKQAEEEIKELNRTLEARAAELQESERRYRLLFDESPQPMWVCDRETLAFLEVNEAAVRHYGYSREEFLRLTLRDIRPAEDVSAFDAYLSQRGHSERYDVATPRHRKKDGSVIDVEVYSYDLTFAERPARVALVYDVTERKRAEEALRLSEAKFRGLLDGAATPIVGVDSHGLIALVNAATERLFGYTREELLNRPVETLVPERFREAHLGHRARYATQPSTRPMGLCMELFARRRDGSEVPVEISLSPAETPEGLLAMAIIIDISARKQAEARLKQQAAELQALNKELEAFTYSVAHDLRSPLRRTDGFAQLLLDEYNEGLPEDAQHYLRRVREGTHQMGQLVDDLLNLARVGRREVNLQVTGLGSLVQEVVAELRRETQGRDIEWSIQPLPFVECDPALMKVVFVNLLSNAVKYTRPRPRAVIEMGSLQKDGQTVIFVRDNGVGFSMKYADKLFGVFQRLHRAEDFEGTGVGLATVQRIVHKHGGHVWAQGELDKGACFYFALGTPQQIEPQVRSDSGRETYVAR